MFIRICNYIPSTLGSALSLAKLPTGPGEEVVAEESSKPPKRSTSGCDAAAGGGADDFFVGLRLEFDTAGVCVISSSPASYSSYWRRLSLKDEPPPPVRLLLPPEL